ncbi:MAG: hypothetical protein ACRDI2_06370, partial [Chloroflexota bacterium]
ALAPPETALESPVYSELDDGTIASIRYRPDLVEESGELLERPEFAFWRPPPDRVAPLAAEWESAERGPLALPPSIVAQRQSAVFDRVVDVVLGPGGVGGFRRRLEDNALVLHRAGATTEARRALAAAARLDPDDPATARTHPFVRALTQQALDLALESRGDEGGEGAALDDVATGGVTDSGASGQGPVTRPSGLILPR